MPMHCQGDLRCDLSLPHALKSGGWAETSSPHRHAQRGSGTGSSGSGSRRPGEGVDVDGAEELRDQAEEGGGWVTPLVSDYGGVGAQVFTGVMTSCGISSVR